MGFGWISCLAITRAYVERRGRHKARKRLWKFLSPGCHLTMGCRSTCFCLGQLAFVVSSQWLPWTLLGARIWGSGNGSILGVPVSERCVKSGLLFQFSFFAKFWYNLKASSSGEFLIISCNSIATIQNLAIYNNFFVAIWLNNCVFLLEIPIDFRIEPIFLSIFSQL